MRKCGEPLSTMPFPFSFITSGKRPAEGHRKVTRPFGLSVLAALAITISDKQSHHNIPNEDLAMTYGTGW
jgi:hypothetical protein